MLFDISSILARSMVVQFCPTFILSSYFAGRLNRFKIFSEAQFASLNLDEFCSRFKAFATASGNFAGDAVATITLGILNKIMSNNLYNSNNFSSLLFDIILNI